MKNWVGSWIWNRLSIRMAVEWEGAKERNMENTTFFKEQNSINIRNELYNGVLVVVRS